MHWCYILAMSAAMSNQHNTHTNRMALVAYCILKSGQTLILNRTKHGLSLGFGLGSESPRTHLSTCVLFRYNTC